MSLGPADLDRLRILLGSEKGLTAAWLFGSQASGRATSDSDIDIGVLGSSPLSAQQCVQLAGKLESELRVERIDVVPVESASPVLAFEIISGICLLNSDPQRHAAFVSLTSRLYEDAMATLERGVQYWKQARAESA